MRAIGWRLARRKLITYLDICMDMLGLGPDGFLIMAW